MGFMLSKHPLTSFFTSSSLINVRPFQVFKVSFLDTIQLNHLQKNKTRFYKYHCLKISALSKTAYSICTRFTIDSPTIQIYLFTLLSRNEIITSRLRSQSSSLSKRSRVNEFKKKDRYSVSQNVSFFFVLDYQETSFIGRAVRSCGHTPKAIQTTVESYICLSTSRAWCKRAARSLTTKI